MNIIANEINTEVRSQVDCFSLDVGRLMGFLMHRLVWSQETLVFLTVGDEKGIGLFLLAGPSGPVTEMGPQ